MKQWLAGLEARERQAVYWGGGVLVLLLVYFIGWRPLTGQVERLEKSVVERRAQAQTMQTAAAEVRRLRAASSRPGAGTDGQSLLAVVDSTARQGQLAGALKRVEPEGQNSVRVWFEDASFDDMVRWIGSLQQQTGAQVSRLTIDRPGAPGRINARLVIEGGR